MWGLTKKFNAHLVKFQGNQISSDPLNLTGLHNASSAGSCNDSALGLTSQKGKSKENKKFRREYTLLQSHKSHNKQIKKKANSQSGNLYSVMKLNHGPINAQKAVKGLSGVSESVRSKALHRMRRLHQSAQANLRKVRDHKRAQ
jgi:hypothetical protein